MLHDSFDALMGHAHGRDFYRAWARLVVDDAVDSLGKKKDDKVHR